MTDPNAAAYPPPPPGHVPPPAAGAYAPSQQGAPGGYPASQPGYPASQGSNGYPAPIYGQAPPSGRQYWGLLFLFCIPYLGIIVAPIVAVVLCVRAKRSPHEIVRGNARWAANWALSFVLYLVVLLGLIIAIGVTTAAASFDGEPSMLIVIPGLLFFAVGIYCLVTMIRGAVLANRVVHRPALAIPFFRA